MDVEQYFRESNAIEDVWSDQALNDSLEAWRFMSEQRRLNLEVLRHAHKLIMKNLDLHIAGIYRWESGVNVMVGGRLCVDHRRLRMALMELLKIEPRSALDALDWHVKYEHLHPFADGNGRSGRLIYAWHCRQLNRQWLMFREKDKAGYYALFDTKC